MVSTLALMLTLHCQGLALDGSTSYNVEAPKNEAGFPTSVVLKRDDTDQLGELTGVDDVTPQGPTDIRYRYVFSNDEAAGGDYAVLIWEGGFTGDTHAQVFALGPDNPAPLATLPCETR